MIIDFHTHSFPDKIAGRVAEVLSHNAHIKYYITPDLTGLRSSMEDAGVSYSVNLPVVSRVDQTTPINDQMIRSLEEARTIGIIHFGGIHPDFEQFASEIRRLSREGIKGIKLHPAYQQVDLNDIRYKRIIGKANEEGMTVSVHAGEDIGLPEHNYASAEMILDVLSDVQPERLVLAHFGGWQGWDQFERYLAGAPVFIDTAFSLGKIIPRKGEESLLIHDTNLSSEEFVRLSRKHGVGKVLFATDSPWASQKEYVSLVENVSLTEEEKRQIFSENAKKLLEP